MDDKKTNRFIARFLTRADKAIEEGIKKVALNALKMGKSISEIIDLTGLTREQIEKLK